MAETATPGSEQSKEQFHFSFAGHVVTLDHGAVLAGSGNFKRYMELGSFAIVSFDPTNGLAEREELKGLPEFQRVPQAVLGTGAPVTLYSCLNEKLTATLEPLASALADSANTSGVQVNPILARTAIPSLQLDAVEGLGSLDWLILDPRHDNIAILEHGEQALANTLLADVTIPLQPTHQGQADFAQVGYWMARHGFRFYRFQDMTLTSTLPRGRELEKVQATEMRSATALYLPTEERLDAMAPNALIKLAFVLHTVYHLHDMAYAILAKADAQQARQYLIAEGYLWPVDEEETEFTLTSTYCPDIWALAQAH